MKPKPQQHSRGETREITGYAGSITIAPGRWIDVRGASPWPLRVGIGSLVLLFVGSLLFVANIAHVRLSDFYPILGVMAFGGLIGLIAFVLDPPKPGFPLRVLLDLEHGVIVHGKRRIPLKKLYALETSTAIAHNPRRGPCTYYGVVTLTLLGGKQLGLTRTRRGSDHTTASRGSDQLATELAKELGVRIEAA